MPFDVESLTLGEIAKIEDLSGQSITSLANDDKPKGKVLAALVLVIKRRENPKYTWNEAMGLNQAEAFELLGWDDAETEDEDGEANPQKPAEKPATSKPARSKSSARATSQSS